MAIKKTQDNITSSTDRILKDLTSLPKNAYEYWRSITPVRSGRARRSTRLQGSEIVADYPYARRLDQGASRQAPQGMSQPTERYIQTSLNRIIRK